MGAVGRAGTRAEGRGRDPGPRGALRRGGVALVLLAGLSVGPAAAKTVAEPQPWPEGSDPPIPLDEPTITLDGAWGSLEGVLRRELCWGEVPEGTWQADPVGFLPAPTTAPVERGAGPCFAAGTTLHLRHGPGPRRVASVEGTLSRPYEAGAVWLPADARTTLHAEDGALLPGTARAEGAAPVVATVEGIPIDLRGGVSIGADGWEWMTPMEPVVVGGMTAAAGHMVVRRGDEMEQLVLGAPWTDGAFEATIGHVHRSHGRWEAPDPGAPLRWQGAPFRRLTLDAEGRPQEGELQGIAELDGLPLVGEVQFHEGAPHAYTLGRTHRVHGVLLPAGASVSPYDDHAFDAVLPSQGGATVGGLRAAPGSSVRATLQGEPLEIVLAADTERGGLRWPADTTLVFSDDGALLLARIPVTPRIGAEEAWVTLRRYEAGEALPEWFEVEGHGPGWTVHRGGPVDHGSWVTSVAWVPDGGGMIWVDRRALRAWEATPLADRR